MLTLSNEMVRALRDHNDITYTVDITLAGHNTVDFTLTEDDLISGGCQITRTNNSEAFPVGYVYCAQLTLQIFRTTALEHIDFFMAKAVVEGVYVYGNETFNIRLGTYTLTEPTTQGEVIQLLGYDAVYAADTPVKNLAQLLPLKATAVFAECCAYCNINFNKDYIGTSYTDGATYDHIAAIPSVPSGWDTCDVMINYIPSGTTYRKLMGAVAMLFGANAYISPYDNQMYVIPVTSQESQIMYWGGYFDQDNPYSSGDSLDGGTFDPWTTGDEITEPFGTDSDVINLDDPLTPPVFPLQDITLGGAKSVDGNYTYGTGYLLAIDASIYAEDPESIIDMVGTAIQGYTFRPFELDNTSFPFADIMQRAMFADSRQRAYSSILTHIDISLKGATVFKCSAESQVRTESTYQSTRTLAEQANSIASNAMETADTALQQIAGTVDALDLEMTRLTSLMANSFGVYVSTEEDAQGGIIYYLHNKSTLATSDIIWRMTASGYMVSVDGGTTWTAGMDASGHAVVNIMSAVGIYADWIRTGLLSSMDGRVYWNLNTGVLATVNSDDDKYIRFTGGQINFYDPDGQRIGFIGTTKTRININAILVGSEPEYVDLYTVGIFGDQFAIGSRNSDTTTSWSYDFFINHDYTGVRSPYNYTQGLLFLNTAMFRKEVTMENNLILSGHLDSGSYVKGTRLRATNTYGSVDIYSDTVTYSWALGKLKTGKLVIKPTSYVSDSSSTFYGSGVVIMDTSSFPGTSSNAYMYFYESMLAVHGAVTCTGDLRSFGAAYATSFNNTSDERMKDVAEWDQRYDSLIEMIEPILFKWKSEDKRDHVGVSAQQVKQALEDLGIEDSGIVSGTEETYYSVSYNELSVLLMRKVKQQQKQIESLEERTSRLERMLNV